MKKKNLAGNIVLLITLTMLLKCMGFVNRIIIAYFYGTTNLTDIYYNASGFVDSISSILLASLAVGVINIYITNKKNGNNDRFLSNLIVVIFVIMTAIGFFVFIGSNKIVYILAPGNNADERTLLCNMLRIMCITFPFQGIIAVYSAVLQAEKNFMPVKLTGTMTSVISIICVTLLAKYFGTTALVVSYICSIIFNAGFLIFNARKIYKFVPKSILRDSDLKKLLILIIPLLLGTAGHEVNLIIDKSIASQIAKGAISALSYSCVLYLFIENVIINSIVTAIFPELAEKKNSNGDKELCRTTIKTIYLAEFLLIPIVICTFFSATDITKIVYMRGSFDRTSLVLTSAALRGYVLGLPFLALRDIVTRVYYTYGDTKKPVIINLIAVGLNIILDIVLSKHMGILGITLSTSISNAFSGCFLVILVKSHNKYMVNKSFIKNILKIFIAVLPIAFCDFIIVNNLNGIFKILLSIILSFILQIIAILGMKIIKIDDIKRMLQLVKGR